MRHKTHENQTRTDTPAGSANVKSFYIYDSLTRDLYHFLNTVLYPRFLRCFPPRSTVGIFSSGS